MTTLDTVKKAVITPEVFSLVGSYLLARTHAELMREQVDKIMAEVLENYPIYSTPRRGEESKRIYQGRYLYLSEDDKACNRAYELFDKAERAAGLKPDDMPVTHCPALVAELLLSDVERAILEIVAPALGLDVDLIYGDTRKKMLDLIVRAVVNHPDFEKPDIKYL